MVYRQGKGKDLVRIMSKLRQGYESAFIGVKEIMLTIQGDVEYTRKFPEYLKR